MNKIFIKASGFKKIFFYIFCLFFFFLGCLSIVLAFDLVKNSFIDSGFFIFGSFMFFYLALYLYLATKTESIYITSEKLILCEAVKTKTSFSIKGILPTKSRKEYILKDINKIIFAQAKNIMTLSTEKKDSFYQKQLNVLKSTRLSPGPGISLSMWAAVQFSPIMYIVFENHNKKLWINLKSYSKKDTKKLIIYLMKTGVKIIVDSSLNINI